MRMEVDLARLHLTVGDQTVDLGALAQAVEAMADLTRGFVATMYTLVQKVSQAATRGATAIRDSVRELVRYTRTVVGMVLRERDDQETFPFPIPEMLLISPAASRWASPRRKATERRPTTTTPAPTTG